MWHNVTYGLRLEDGNEPACSRLTKQLLATQEGLCSLEVAYVASSELVR
jgi:hypothetical protein